VDNHRRRHWENEDAMQIYQKLKSVDKKSARSVTARSRNRSKATPKSSQIPQLLLLPLCAGTIFGPLPAQEQAPVLCPLFHFGTKFHQHGDKAAVLIVQKSSETFDA
jgi:hypothetical protein